MRSDSRRKRSKRFFKGAVAVELAFLSMPFVLLGLAAVEYGRLMFTYETLVKSAREGARYMSTYNPDALPDTDYRAALTRARNRVAYAANTVQTTTLAIGLSANNVCIYDRRMFPEGTNAAGVGANPCSNGPTANSFRQINTGVPATAGGANIRMNAVQVVIRGYTFDSLFPKPLVNTLFEPISVVMEQR